MKTAHENPDPGAHLRLLVRILQEVVRDEDFTTYGDLKEAFKTACAQLHVYYDAGLIADALDQVERGGETPLVPLPAFIKRRVEERPPEPEVFSPAEAAAVLARLNVTVPTVAKPVDQAAHDARNKAAIAEVYREARKPRPLAERLAAIFDEQP